MGEGAVSFAFACRRVDDGRWRGVLVGNVAVDSQGWSTTDADHGFDGDKRRLSVFDIALCIACAIVGTLWCLGLVTFAVFVVVRGSLIFVPKPAARGSPPGSNFRTRIVRWLLLVRGEWQEPTKAPHPSLDESTAESSPTRLMVAAANHDDDGGNECDRSVESQPPVASVAFLIYRPLFSSVRSGSSARLAFARFGVAVDVALTAVTATIEAWGSTKCAEASHACVASAAMAGVSFLYLFVCAPHPSPLKAALAAVNAALGVVTATLMGMATVGGITDGQALAEHATSVAFSSVAVSVASVLTSLAVWWLRRRVSPSQGSRGDAVGSPMLAVPSTTPSSLSVTARVLNPLGPPLPR